MVLRTDLRRREQAIQWELLGGKYLLAFENKVEESEIRQPSSVAACALQVTKLCFHYRC